MTKSKWFRTILILAVVLAGVRGLLGLRTEWVAPEVIGFIATDASYISLANTVILFRVPNQRTMEAKVNESGRFHFQAVKSNKFSILPGGRSSSSQLEILTSDGARITHDIQIWNSELLSSKPPTVYFVAIDLSQNAKRKIRERSVSWQERQYMSGSEFQQLEQAPELWEGYSARFLSGGNDR